MRTARFLAELDFPDGDPRLVTCAVAMRLARALDERPSGAIAHELRVAVDYVSELPNEPADRIDELRALRARRRLEMLLTSTHEW